MRAALLIVLLLPIAACGQAGRSTTAGSGAPAAAASAAPSAAAPTPVTPHASASAPVRACTRTLSVSRSVTVGPADDGSTICLVAGQELQVSLPPDGAGGWQQVGVVGPALSRPMPGSAAPSGALSASVRATGPGAGRVLAVHSCPGEQGCRTWRVEVVVRSG